jgi:hypothetical protein
MVLQLNHLQGKPAGVTTHEVVDGLCALLEEGHLEEDQFAHLRVHLHGIQYRQNFRDFVMAIKAGTGRHQSPAFEPHKDARQATTAGLRDRIRRTVGELSAGSRKPVRSPYSLRNLGRFGKALPGNSTGCTGIACRIGNRSPGVDMSRRCRGGKSDANHPAAVADCVADFLDAAEGFGNEEAVARGKSSFWK